MKTLSPLPLHHTTCRACEAPLVQAFTLGNLHLSGFPEPAREGGSPLPAPFPRIPLTVMVCEGCQLVQLQHTTPFGWMYGQAHYWYRSGINESMRAELRDVALRAALTRGQGEGPPIVVDVGANDGTLLRTYPKSVTKIAVEPSASLHEELRQHCAVLIPEAFPSPALEAYEGKVDILTAVAMLYDLEHPAEFFLAVSKLLSPTGICLVQFQDLLQQLERTAFDVICHEHLEYYSLWSLLPLIHRAGLEVLDVEARAINGGSLRLTLGRQPAEIGERVLTWMAREHAAGLTETTALLTQLHYHFDAIQTCRRQIRGILEQVRDYGGEIDLFGASTKANTLLQVFDLDSSWIRQAIERSPEKIGRCVGQTGIPIVSEAEGRQDPAALSLVGIWQFREGLIGREADYLARGGKLLFPLPRVEMVAGPGVTALWGDGEGVA
jgi:NDP-4-keto-2,6-dideoxyhexose 3-C-methyltransferase